MENQSTQENTAAVSVGSDALVCLSFKDALKRLNIEDYSERIINSSSTGELMHIADYIGMATQIKGDASWFRPLFVECVEWAEKNWKRPASCYQHMPRLMNDMPVTIAQREAAHASIKG